MNREKFNNLLFLPLELDNPPIDCLDYLASVSFNSLISDDYRNCYHVPLMFDQQKRNYQWTPFSDNTPTLVEWCEDVLFPITGRSRVVVITTPAGHTNPLHIDCSPHTFHEPQHKFRYVLQGNVSDLTFVEGETNRISPPEIDKPFVMSGKWPHYMTNTTNDTKFTLALGAPWDGRWEDEKYVELLTKSYKKWGQYNVSGEGFKLPPNWETLFEKK